jgi:hypothetical protein
VAKLKEITVAGSYTYQPLQYHSARGEMSFTVELEDGDDIEEVQDGLRDDIIKGIVMTLAGIEDVHTKIQQGHSPEDLLADASDMLPMEDDSEDLGSDWG